MSGTLAAKTALITGASSGIGSAVAERFAAEGASLLLHYGRNGAAAEAAASAARAHGVKAETLQADLSGVAGVRRLFAAARERSPRLDVVVLNAGAPMLLNPIASVSEEEFDLLFNLNAKATFFALQEAAASVRDGGRIIAISSAATLGVTANKAVVTASKAAIEHFTGTLAHELGPRGVTVNAVLPGPTATEKLETFLPADLKADLASRTPLGRLAEPRDIADVIAFLASDQARWITGQRIHATGGMA